MRVKLGLKIWGKCQKMPACVLADGGHFAHDVNWVVTLNMAYVRQSCR